MSESSPGSKPNLDDVAFDLAFDLGASYIPTHPRFSLSSKESFDMLVQPTDIGERYRILITSEDPSTEEIYKKIHNTGTTQFPRHQYKSGLVVYNLPEQVKPLAYERFYVGRESTETYVSDKEQFKQLGKLWHDIFRATGKLPSAPLEATALQDFEIIEKALIPIPPYSSWESPDNEQSAFETLTEGVIAGLKESNPGIAYRSLIDALSAGWIGHDER